MNAAELVVKLFMDSGRFAQEANKAQGKTDQLAQSQKKFGDEAKKASDKAVEGAQKAGSAWEGLKGKLMGLVSVGAIVGSAMQFSEQTKQVEAFANRLGMSVEDWQTWAGAAEAAGGTAEDFADKLRDVTDWIVDLNVNGSGPLKDFAEQVGVSFKDASGASVDVQEGFLRIADAAEQMDRQKATGWLTQMGFNQESIDLLLKGRKGVEALLKVQREKLVYDKQDLDNGKKIRESYNQLNKTYQLIGARMMAALMPVFEKVGEWAGKAFDFIKEHADSVERVFKMIGVAISAMLIPKLKQMAVAAWASLGPWTLLIAAFAAIGLAIDDLIVWMEGGESALGDFWSMFGTAEEVKAKIEGLKTTFFEVFESIKPMLPILAKLFAGFLGIVSLWRTFKAAAAPVKAVGSAFKTGAGIMGSFGKVLAGVVVPAAKAVGTALKAVFILLRANPIGAILSIIAAIAAAVIANWDKIGPKVKEVWDGIVGAAVDAWESIKGAWDAAVGTIAGAVDSALETVKGIFEGAANFVRQVWEDLFGWLTSKFDAIAGAAQKVVSFGKGIVGSVTSGVKNFFGFGSKDKGAQAGADTGASTPARAGMQAPTLAQAHAPAGTGTMSEGLATGGYGAPANAKPANVSNDNRRTVNIDQTNNITVQTQASSPDGIGSAVGEAMNRNTTYQAEAAFGA